MFFGDVRRHRATAAWRITAVGVLVFALGSGSAFLILQGFLVRDMHSRADRWLLGELGQLTSVVERTPDGSLHDSVIREVADLGSKEVPYDGDVPPSTRNTFFLITQADGKVLLATEAEDVGPKLLSALQTSCGSDGLCEVRLNAFASPVRVARSTLSSGQHLFLGLTYGYEQFFLRRLQVRFLCIWVLVLGLSSGVLFLSVRQMLSRVEAISDTAKSIGKENLNRRFPSESRNDEISRLTLTFNEMLHRIELTMKQMNTMSDAIAHDIRTPLTVIRVRLESMLSNEDGSIDERIPPLIESIDQLNNLLSVSLDISEANAHALRYSPVTLDVAKLLGRMLRLYEPMFHENGISLQSSPLPSSLLYADANLLERVFMNLLENTLNHAQPGSKLLISIAEAKDVTTIQFEDTGPGFPMEILSSSIEPFTRGSNSKGSGLGLAFVAAVLRMQGGSVQISNAVSGGARVVLNIPRSSNSGLSPAATTTASS